MSKHLPATGRAPAGSNQEQQRQQQRGQQAPTGMQGRGRGPLGGRCGDCGAWYRLPDLMAEAFAAGVDVGKAIAAALSGRYAVHVRDLSSSGECPAGFARQTRPGIFFAGSRHRRRLNQCLRVGEYLLRSPLAKAAGPKSSSCLKSSRTKWVWTSKTNCPLQRYIA
jgi:hypothetical protein